MTTNIETIITFILYITGMLLLGLIGYKATKNLSDYILGGRKLGSFVTALSAGASDMSGWLLLGIPGAVFLSGMSSIVWMAIGLTVGQWLNWRFVAARLRLYSEKSGNAVTIPDYLSNRFEDRTHLIRITASIAILVFFTIYCASGVVAGALLFEDMFSVPYITALWLGAFATIAYVFIGGFLAVSWTDTVQASLMISALLITPLMVIYSNGGLNPSIAAVHMVNPSHTDIISNLGAIEIISMLAWGLGYFGQPHILVRFMAAKNIDSVMKARRINITWMILCLAGAIAIGFFGSAYFIINPQHAAAVNQDSETVFIEVAKQLFNPWMTGFLLAAILAAIMSTLSCQLLLCSSALTQDIYKTFFHKNASDKQLVWFGRLMVMAVAFIAIFIASNPQSRVLQMVSYAWAGFGAAFGPAILFSLLWPRMTRNGALAGIIVGTLTVIIWKQVNWFNLYEIVPGFIFSSLAIVIVSLLNAAPAHSINQLFKSVNQEIVG